MRSDCYYSTRLHSSRYSLDARSVAIWLVSRTFLLPDMKGTEI